MAELDLPWQLPKFLKDEILTWEHFHKSPYGRSFYNLPGKDHGVTPLNIVRVSDHWNYDGHAPTDIKPPNTSHWSMGKWNGERYIISHVAPRRSPMELFEDEADALPEDLQKHYQAFITKRGVPMSPRPPWYIG